MRFFSDFGFHQHPPGGFLAIHQSPFLPDNAVKIHGPRIQFPRRQDPYAGVHCEQMSPFVKKAVLAAEDQRFSSHNGFDLIELNAAIKDMVMGKGFRGASTITMQVARTVFLWPARTWVRKGLEAYYTVLLEIFLSKKRILEVYLNTVDWGEGIRGVEAAARAYYHVSASRVSRGQAALLAAILPSPHRWSPIKPNARVLRRQKSILKDMNKMALE